IWTLAPGRHETDDPPVAGVYHEPAVLAAAVDHGDSVDEAALVRHAEWRKAVVAQHRIDFLRRQQSRARPRAIGAIIVARRRRGARPGLRTGVPAGELA